MLIFRFLIIFLFICTFSVTAQDNSLKDQFVEVIDKSNSYHEFKVIKKVDLATLRANVLDTVTFLEQKVTASANKIENQKNNIASLKQNLKTSQENLSLSKKKEDSIHLLGISTNKSIYNSIMWSIIGFLLVLIGILFFNFKNSHTITKATQLKLTDLEEEFEVHRQRNLERDQQLRRKLQDEINKNRNI